MNKKIITKVVVSTRISDEYDALLQAYADMFGIDKSEIISEAIIFRVNDLKAQYGIPASYKAPSEG